MSNARPSAPFVRFLSSVEGHLVGRYGSGSPRVAPVQIGATRSARYSAKGKDVLGLERSETTITWNPEEVVALTEVEARLFSREYNGHVERGELRERTAEDYDAWVERETARAAAMVAAEQAAAEAKAEKAAAEKALSTGADG